MWNYCKDLANMYNLKNNQGMFKTLFWFITTLIIFTVLAIISISKDNVLFTKLVLEHSWYPQSELWQVKTQKQSDSKTVRRQTNRLGKLIWKRKQRWMVKWLPKLCDNITVCRPSSASTLSYCIYWLRQLLRCNVGLLVTFHKLKLSFLPVWLRNQGV